MLIHVEFIGGITMQITMTNKEIKTLQRPINNQWASLKYVFGLCVLLLLLIKFQYYMYYVYVYVFHIPYDSLFYDFVDIVLHVAVFIVVIGVGLKDQKKTLTSVCLFKKVNGNVWVAAVLCSIGYVLFDYYLTALFYSFNYGWDMDFGEPEGNFLYNLIDTAIIPAVAEELLFKGVIFTVLRKRFSVVSAVIITSLLFAGCHLELIRIIPLFICSCITFWLYLRSGSLILPMIIHFTNNLSTFVPINVPFASRGTFFVALVLLGIGSCMLYSESKAEKELQKGVKKTQK